MKTLFRGIALLSLVLFSVGCRATAHAENTHTFHSRSFPNAPKSTVDLPTSWKSWDDYASGAGRADTAHQGSKVFASGGGGDYPARFFWSVYECTTDCDDLQALVARLSKSQFGELSGYTQTKQQDDVAKRISGSRSSRFVGSFTDPASHTAVTGVWTYVAKKADSGVYLYVVETDAKQSDFAKEEESFTRIHDSFKLSN